MTRMVVCPVCEHEQEQGSECLVCGKRLLSAGAPDDPTPRLDGLEGTCVEALPAPEPERMADLEPTMRESAPPSVPDGPAPWIEHTARAPVQAVTVEALEIERTALAAHGASDQDPFALSTCRYCRTPAAPGEIFCGRCGLKLAIYRPRPPEERRGPLRRCRACGAAGAGDACPSCGSRLPPEA